MSDVDNHDSLSWLSGILWPDGSARIVAVPADDPAARWWASPSIEKPAILIPIDDAASRAAVRRYHDGFEPAKRLRSLVAEATMRVPGLAPRLLGGRALGVVGPGADGGVPRALAEVLQVGGLRLAVSLSHPKSNRKPVLQLLGDDGRAHGWAKVAWNDWTDALVGNEARWLLPRPLPPVSTPSLVNDVELEGRRVVVTSGFTSARLPRRRLTTPPSPAVFRAVSALGSQEVTTIMNAAWFRSVQPVLRAADATERHVVESALSRAESHRLQLGAWHGDLTPWNMMTVGGTTQIIDWEFAADGVPLGFDLCHFHTQVATEMKGMDADEALAYSARLAPQGLATLGVSPENHGQVFQLYLVELVRRGLALRAAGRDTSGLTQPPAALRRLSRAVTGNSLTGRGADRRFDGADNSDPGLVRTG